MECEFLNIDEALFILLTSQSKIVYLEDLCSNPLSPTKQHSLIDFSKVFLKALTLVSEIIKQI